MTLRTGSSRNAKPARWAFTLIELILVMAMLAVVIAVAAPSLSKFFKGRTLESEARRFLSLTHYAQSRAASEGMPVVLWIDVMNHQYGVERDSSYTTETDERALSYELGEDLVFEVAARNNLAPPSQKFRNLSVIRFLPDGSISEQSVETVTIRQSETEALWIVQARNGLTYEIRNENEVAQAAVR